MDHYRLYFLEDDHIRRAEVLDAASDEEALEKAAQHLGAAHALELWLRDRRVGRIEAEQG